MDYIKKVLVSTKNYKITYHKNKHSETNKCIITFGEIDSDLDEVGFGSQLIMSEGLDHIYVAQKKSTQYQFLSAKKFSSSIQKVIRDKEVYTYGSSLGAYCAIYYGGAINANILAMSPRIPAHPVMNKLMGERFRNRGFRHDELTNIKTSSNNVYIFYDKHNYFDSYYINFFLKLAYPNAHYFHIDHAGHYTARALLLSGELKNTALNFFYNQKLDFKLNDDKILEWHMEKTAVRLEKGKLAHAQENLEVLLKSNKADDPTTKELLSTFKDELLLTSTDQTTSRRKQQSNTYPIITNNEKQQIENAVSLSFVGDLILLRDQVLNAYNPENDEYEFDDMFTYVKKYLSETDFSMGVFEGPTAGESKEYSTSVYADKIPLYLNFPDSFAYAVRRAGFNFVTTAQNHLLDCGVEGAMRTLDVLDKSGLSHLGCYRNSEEKEKLPIFDIKGLKVAILTYTKRSNRYTNDFFLEEENKHLTSILVAPSDEHFERVKKDVLDDFARIKQEKPDCIVVLPHMGRQFRHSPDIYQQTWCDIFVNAGADVILSDHPHAVQPYEWRKKPETNQNVLILHCPGNFVNSYVQKDGDASALTQIYLNKKSGEPFAVACIPLWSHSYVDGNHRALPLYEVVHNTRLRKTISTHEFSRVKEIHHLITNTMLGEDLSIDQVQEKYFLFADRATSESKGYVRNHVSPLVLTDEVKQTSLYTLLKASKSVCFIGDSVTEGTRNGGYGWFEPLIENFQHLTVKRFAKGGATTSYFLENSHNLSNKQCDLYVIAVGTNDVRYRDPKRCAMTREQYIDNIKKLVKTISSQNKTSKFVLIAPWTTDEHDPVSKLDKKERFNMLSKYSKALKKYAQTAGHLYIDPNHLIKSKFGTRNPKTWLKDHIHPNANEGINLYSWAVVQASPRKVSGLRRLARKIRRKMSRALNLKR
ncbi:CapA family protein [Salipaludibacillus agaradhaerens]|uniref:CapA family protein n=1 Tax=Salipaludibacillus agaradhaerens TaxID=76935 RepID=A0A9Q4B4L0_SALAG|nr:CapA family protein [Salipaludibacillus agaradhaerens]MCR6098227.1 CapA family protein [Salipaludibacillus agaradhaerens]MCR6116143.1 CapA family protein [Salipaludibacillus agaradhaerens]